jgi:hypothetical protein
MGEKAKAFCLSGHRQTASIVERKKISERRGLRPSFTPRRWSLWVAIVVIRKPHYGIGQTFRMGKRESKPLEFTCNRDRKLFWKEKRTF